MISSQGNRRPPVSARGSSNSHSTRQAGLGADGEAGELFQVVQFAREEPACGGWREGQRNLVTLLDEGLEQAGA
jgi:hypothetical protein